MNRCAINDRIDSTRHYLRASITNSASLSNFQYLSLHYQLFFCSISLSLSLSSLSLSLSLSIRAPTTIPLSLFNLLISLLPLVVGFFISFLYLLMKQINAVAEYTPIHVKINTKLINFMKLIRIEYIVVNKGRTHREINIF